MNTKESWNTMNLSKNQRVEGETLFTSFIFSLGMEETPREFKVTQGLINLGNKIEILKQKVNRLNDKIKSDSV